MKRANYLLKLRPDPFARALAATDLHVRQTLSRRKAVVPLGQRTASAGHAY